MTYFLLAFLSLSAWSISCEVKCKSSEATSDCYKHCAPEIYSFCQDRFKNKDMSVEDYKAAFAVCIKGAIPCHDSCQGKTLTQQKTCRDECLGN